MEGLPLQSSKKPSTRGRQKRKNETPPPAPFEVLCAADHEINPAIVLAEELMRKDITGGMDFCDIEEAEKTLRIARDEIANVERHFACIVKTPPQASGYIPAGF